MKTFQSGLNQDTDDFRRTSWKNHREQVTGLFEEVFSQKETFNKIAIFGAGNCDDLDLEYLASKCKSIYLFDIDLESVRFAVESLQGDFHDKIKVFEKDFTGLDKLDFYNEFSLMLENVEKSKKIRRYIIKTANQLSAFLDDNWRELYKKFDIVASSAIYTQLFYNWSLNKLFEFEDKYDDKEIRSLIHELIYLRNKIVQLYNDSIYKTCNEEGFLVSWSDILELQEEHTDIINQGLEATMNLAGQIGFQAAMIGIKDISRRMEKSSYKFEYWNWDFNRDKRYLTFGVAGVIK